MPMKRNIYLIMINIFNSYNYEPDKLNSSNKIISQNSPIPPTTGNSSNLLFSKSNEPLLWFNSKLSTANEPYDISTFYAVNSPTSNYSINQISIQNGSLISNQKLLSNKIGFIKEISGVGISLGSIFIIGILICSIILVLLMSNLFINKNERFMFLMQAEGYSKKEINSYILGIFTPVTFISYIIGYSFSLVITQLSIYIIQGTYKIAVPYSFHI